jgi:hypothetical protein
MLRSESIPGQFMLLERAQVAAMQQQSGILKAPAACKRPGHLSEAGFAQ